MAMIYRARRLLDQLIDPYALTACGGALVVSALLTLVVEAVA